MEMMVRLGQGDKLTDLCREYGISRKTGEKFKKRFREHGPAGLTDQSRAPKLIPHKTPPELVTVLLAERRLHPTWGARKLKEVLERRLGRSFPAPSTIGDVLGEHGTAITPARPPAAHWTCHPCARSETSPIFPVAHDDAPCRLVQTPFLFWRFGVLTMNPGEPEDRSECVPGSGVARGEQGALGGALRERGRPITHHPCGGVSVDHEFFVQQTVLHADHARDVLRK